MSRDVIGDFLTIIRNGVASSHDEVQAPYSHLKYHIATLLTQEGFVRNLQISGEGAHKVIIIGLKYVDGESTIHEIKRISKPSARIYRGIDGFAPVIGGLGISIVTTNKGVMTHKQARKLRVGGEVICTVW